MKPTYVVEAAFGAGALTDPGTWTDITHYVRSHSTRRGRNHELGRTQAGVASIVLDNTDRRFDPTNGSSPYYPNVRPMTHIRIRATAPLVAPLFRGYVQDWGQGWPGPMPAGKGDATVTLGASDAFVVLSLMQLQAYRSAVLADGPIGYWPLDDAAIGATTHDAAALAGDPLSSDSIVGSYPMVGVAGPLIGGATGAWGNGQTTSLVSPVGIDDAFGLSRDCTLEAWVRETSVVAYTMFNTGDSASVREALEVFQSGGNLYVRFRSGGGAPAAQSTGSLSLGSWHHIAAVRTGSSCTYYIDGLPDSTVPCSSGLPFVAGTMQVTALLAAVPQQAHLAIYDHALSAAQIASHYASKADAFVVQPSGTAVGRILDAVGWPAGLRAIDAGASTVTFTPAGSALDVLQQVAEDTEHGILMVAGDGKVTFIARDTIEKLLIASRTFGDGGGTEVPYGDLEIAYDDQDLWTQANVSGPPGAVVATDATAAATYGTRTLEVSTLAATINELTDQATGLLNRYKIPALRPKTLRLRGDRSTPTQLAALIGDRVAIMRRPPGGGTMNIAALIEGVDQDLGSDGWADVTYQLGAPEPAAFWLLADTTFGVLDASTRLGW